MTPFDPAHTALLLIDVQQGFDAIAATGMPRNNPEALDCIASLLAAFRASQTRIIHVHHASTEPASVFRPDALGYSAMPAARPLEDETMIVKEVNSAFIGTGLETHLRAENIRTLVIAGATTNHCVETTVRMAGNLGFDTRLVEDACWTFDRTGPDGRLHKAADIHAMTLANMSGEFAEIVSAGEVAGLLVRSGSLADFLLNSPLRGSGIDLERVHSQPREIDFE